MKKILIISFLMFTSITTNVLAETQNKKNSDSFVTNHSDFFHLFFSERTDLRVGYLNELNAKEQSGSGEYKLQNAYIDGLFQAQISKDSFMSFGGTLDARSYDFTDNISRADLDKENLYKLEFQPGIGAFLNDDFLFWAQAKIGSYSDLDKGPLQIDNYQLLGNVQLVYRLNPGAQLIGGVSYSNDYLEQRLLPFLGIRLLSDTGALHVSIDLPFSARVGYYLTPKIETFVKLIAKGDRYRMRLNGEDFDVGVHDERGSIGLRFWLGNHVSWTFEGGRTLTSQLKFYAPAPGQFIGGDIESHWFAQSYLGLAF